MFLNNINAGLSCTLKSIRLRIASSANLNQTLASSSDNKGKCVVCSDREYFWRQTPKKREAAFIIIMNHKKAITSSDCVFYVYLEKGIRV